MPSPETNNITIYIVENQRKIIKSSRPIHKMHKHNFREENPAYNNLGNA